VPGVWGVKKNTGEKTHTQKASRQGKKAWGCANGAGGEKIGEKRGVKREPGIERPTVKTDPYQKLRTKVWGSGEKKTTDKDPRKSGVKLQLKKELIANKD